MTSQDWGYEGPLLSKLSRTKTCDVLHYFTSCVRTQAVWNWVRMKLSKLCDVQHSSKWDFLKLCFTGRLKKEKTVTWLLGVYLKYAWGCRNDSAVNFNRYFAYLSFKYKDQKDSIGFIDGL